jgi:hypothetical protein
MYRQSSEDVGLIVMGKKLAALKHDLRATKFYERS